MGDSYVCGLNGWYENKVGVERNVAGGGCAFCSLTGTYKYEPGKEIKMTAGAINGHIFMVVDDELVSKPIEYKDYLTSGHVGFSPYCTMLKIKDIEIREIYWEECNEYYELEF
ncbi:MAG: hypothetical protein IJ506_01820 [Clostridia bacterium]|nr:hypothetical protein [Clostridia bacterium]